MLFILPRGVYIIRRDFSFDMDVCIHQNITIEIKGMEIMELYT